MRLSLDVEAKSLLEGARGDVTEPGAILNDILLDPGPGGGVDGFGGAAEELGTCSEGQYPVVGQQVIAGGLGRLREV